MNAKELLLKVPQAVQMDADAPDAVIQYDLPEPIYHQVQAGEVFAVEGHAEAPDVTVKVSEENLLRLFRGELNPMTAMMTGRLKVKGNVMLAQRLLSLVDRAKLEAARDQIIREG